MLPLKVLSCEIGAVRFMSGAIAKLTLSISKKSTEGPIHWILKIDVSGSVSWALAQIKRDLQAFIAALPGNHFVSIVVFSGHGEARLIAGPTKCDADGQKLLAARISGMRTLSTTVFSEPLKLAVETARTLNVPGLRHVGVLFTDGCPVPTMWNEATEVAKATDQASQLGSQEVSLSTIGYGNYYNASFLAGLVGANGQTGVRRHINDIANFASVVADIRHTGEHSEPVKAELHVRTPQGVSGIVLRAEPEVQKVGDEGNIFLNSVMDGVVTLFVSLPPGSKEMILSGTVGPSGWLQEKMVGKPLSPESAGEAAYAFAAYAFENDNLVRSAELLQEAGNETLANLVGNAYTDRERLTIGDELRRILKDAGVRKRYVLKTRIGGGTARCVVNALRLLLEEDCEVFIPKGSYVQTTVTTVEEDVKYLPEARIKVIEIQSHQERYNISVKTSVDVLEQKGGSWVPGARFRNYVIIKDGNLHQGVLEAYLTEKAFRQFQEWDVIPASAIYSVKTIYTLDFADMPVIINSWANPQQLGLVGLMKAELDLEEQQKAANRRLKELRTEASSFPTYASKTKLDEELDYYHAPAYEYELKGYAPKKVDYSSITDLQQMDTICKQVRKKLLNVRCVKRLILFAMDKTGNKLFTSTAPVPVKRSIGKKNKMEQIVSLATLGEASLSLRRITWTENCPITTTAVGDEEEVAVGA